MRSFKASAILAAAFAGLFVGSASAQEALVAKIPFSFVVHGEQFAPGRYNVSNQAGILTIRGLDSRAQMFALVMPTGGDDPAGDRPALVFIRHENQYRLSEIWESTTEGLTLTGGSRQVSHADATRPASGARTIVLASSI